MTACVLRCDAYQFKNSANAAPLILPRRDAPTDGCLASVDELGTQSVLGEVVDRHVVGARDVGCVEELAREILREVARETPRESTEQTPQHRVRIDGAKLAHEPI